MEIDPPTLHQRPEVQPLILIADDVAANITVLASALHGLAQIIFATDGAAALALAHERAPEVILLDIEMPGMDGYEVCKALKSSPRTAGCAVIFVTGHHAEAHELASLSEGAVDFLQKPFNPAVARARVRVHLELQARTRQLHAAQQDLSDLVDALPAFVAYWDQHFTNRFCNDREGLWFGMAAAAMHARPLEQVVGPAHAGAIMARAAALAPGEEVQFEMTVGPPAQPNYCRAALVRRAPRRGVAPGFLLLLTDVSPMKRVEMALHDEKEKLRVTLNSIGDAVIATDLDGIVTFINPVAELMTGFSSDEAIGLPIETAMPLVDGTTGATSVNPVRLALSERRVVGMAFDAQLLGRAGRRYAVEDSAAPICDAAGRQRGAIIVFHDVSEARAMAFKMTHLAQHDALTDLPNRVLLRDRIYQALGQAERSRLRVALLLLDVDNFKAINTALGHATGDALLKQLAQRLRQGLRASDTLSRQGGDEFVILMPALDDIGRADQVARHLLSLVAMPLYHDGQRYDLTASIGLSVFPDDCSDQEAMHRHADAAMYKAKQDGRNRYHFFASEIERDLLSKNAMERDLRGALDMGELSLAYQPKVDGRSHRIVGLEALVRWRRADGSQVSPADFIPLAEQTGLIAPIGALVLAHACRDLAELCAAGCPTRIAVNISGREFGQAGFAERIAAALRQAGAPPTLLELEITEGVLMKDIARSREGLQQLKLIGVSISIDDFGTGYSSLSYLKNFPIDVLKIDQSFVRDMLTDKNDSAIIRAIIHLADSLGIGLLAEGVEQAGQRDALVEMGCHAMQGYLYARPAPLATLRPMLALGMMPAP